MPLNHMRCAGKHAHDGVLERAAHLFQGGLFLLFSKTVQQLSLNESLHVTTCNITAPANTSCDRYRQLAILSCMVSTQDART